MSNILKAINTLTETKITNLMTIIKQKRLSGINEQPELSFFKQNYTLYFMPCFVRDTNFFSSLGPAVVDNPASVGRSHTAPESVLVPSLPSRWLECPLHSLPCLN